MVIAALMEAIAVVVMAETVAAKVEMMMGEVVGVVVAASMVAAGGDRY